MSKLEELKKYFKDEERFYQNLGSIYSLKENLKTKYRFLGFNDESWDNIIYNTAVKLTPYITIKELKEKLEAHLKNYIKREILALKPRIVCNLIIVSKGKTAADLIKNFLKNLSYYDIDIKEPFYNVLKEEPVFKNAFGDISYNEFKILNNKNIDQYLSLRVPNCALAYNIAKVNYFLRTLRKSINELSREDILKIKTFISYYRCYSKLEEYMKNYNANVVEEDIYRLLFTYPLDKFEQFKENIIYFKYDEQDNMPDFLAFLYSKLQQKSQVQVVKKEEPKQLPSKNKPEKVKAEKKEVTKENTEKKSTAKTDNKMRGSKIKDLYSRFLIKEGRSEEDRRQELDELVGKILTEEEKKLLFAYLNNELTDYQEKTKALNIIRKLKINYEGKAKPTCQGGKIKDLYSRFELRDGQTEEQRKQEVDELIKQVLTEEQRILLFTHLNNELTDNKEKMRANNIIRKLKANYERKSKTTCQRGKIKDLYSRFEVKDGKSEENRKQEVDELIEKVLTEEEKKLLFAYLNNKLTDNKEKKRANNIINKIRQYYNGKYKEPKGVKDLYSRFLIKEGKTEEDRKKEIDELVEKVLMEDEKELLFAYLNKKSLAKEEKIKVTRIILKLRNHYKGKHKEVKPKGSIKDIYSRFELRDGQTEEERKQEIDALIIKTLPEEQKKLLFAYLNNELTDQKQKAKAGSVILKLKNHYTGKSIKPRLMIYSTDIYSYFEIKEGQTEDEKKELIDSLIAKVLTEEEQILLASYMKREVTDKRKKKKAQNLIQRIKYHYNHDSEKTNLKRLPLDLYYRFPIKEGKSEEDRKQELDELIKQVLKEEEQVILEEYLNRKIKDNKKRKKALYLIEKLKKCYNKDNKININPIKSLYLRFELKEGQTEDERKEEIDSLIEKILSDNERECLLAFLNNELTNPDDKHIARNIIKRLRKAYDNDLSNYADNKRWLLDYFNFNTDISNERLSLLKEKLMLLEYQYTYIKGLSDYKAFAHDVMMELIYKKPDESFEYYITEYIEILTNYLTEKEDKRSL